MKVVNYLDGQQVMNDINAHPTWWASEGEDRKYIRIGEEMAITHGKLGMVATIDEWRIIAKLLNADVIKAIKGIIEDFDDMKRMDIRYCYGKREKR